MKLLFICFYLTLCVVNCENFDDVLPLLDEITAVTGDDWRLQLKWDEYDRLFDEIEGLDASLYNYFIEASNELYQAISDVLAEEYFDEEARSDPKAQQITNEFRQSLKPYGDYVKDMESRIADFNSLFTSAARRKRQADPSEQHKAIQDKINKGIHGAFSTEALIRDLILKSDIQIVIVNDSTYVRICFIVEGICKEIQFKIESKKLAKLLNAIDKHIPILKDILNGVLKTKRGLNKVINYVYSDVFGFVTKYIDKGAGYVKDGAYWIGENTYTLFEDLFSMFSKKKEPKPEPYPFPPSVNYLDYNCSCSGTSTISTTPLSTTTLPTTRSPRMKCVKLDKISSSSE